MTRSRTLATSFAVTAPLMLAMTAPALARTGDRSGISDLCLQAAVSASRETGVPLRVLLALTLTETGRQQDGGFSPWPWALNRGGESFWFATREEAMAQLEDAIGQGASNIDIGCFQVNFRWHGAAFASLDQMMDPETNALYAARLVARHAKELGDWVAAAGAYHSATPDKAETYLSRFRPIYAALGPDPDVGAPLPEEPDATALPRLNNFPLLMAGGTGSAGSIVPLAASRRPLIGGP